jgi:type I restriction enzyme S subunit
LALVRADDQIILPEYLFLILNSKVFKDAVAVSSSYGTQPNIGMGVIQNIQVPVPPMEEQRRILKCVSAKLDAISSIRKDIQQAVRLIIERRAALVTAAVTGQIDVTTHKSQVRYEVA